MSQGARYFADFIAPDCTGYWFDDRRTFKRRSQAMNKEQPEVTQIGMQGVTAETINAKIDQSVNKAVIHQAPKSNQPIPSNVRQGSKNFVGREEELEDIHAKLQEGQGVIACAVEGMGGVGKTELALQYATQPNSISVKPSSIKVSQKKISSSILILSTRSSCSRVVTTSVNILPVSRVLP